MVSLKHRNIFYLIAKTMFKSVHEHFPNFSIFHLNTCFSATSDGQKTKIYECLKLFTNIYPLQDDLIIDNSSNFIERLSGELCFLVCDGALRVAGNLGTSIHLSTHSFLSVHYLLSPSHLNSYYMRTKSVPKFCSLRLNS